MESIFNMSGGWLGFLGTVTLSLVTYVVNRYVIPFLKVGERQKYAGYVAAIADDLTDELRLKYPEKEWLKHLDEAIEALVSICGVNRDIAGRALSAAAARK